MLHFFKSIAVITTLTVACLSTVQAKNHAQLMKNGMYEDASAGLMWMRCSLGQQWEDGKCEGKPMALKYVDSADYLELYNENVKFGGYSDWRLPTVTELEGLRQCISGKWRQEKPGRKIGDMMTKASGPVVKVAIGKNAFSKKIAEECAPVARKKRSDVHADIKLFPGITSKGNGYQTSSKHPNWNPNHTFRWIVGFSRGSVYGRTERNGHSFLLVRDAK